VADGPDRSREGGIGDGPSGDGADGRIHRWSRVGSFPSRAAAGFAAAVLEDAGIPGRVMADDGGGTLPHLEPLTGGVWLQVPTSQADEARSMLEELQASEEPTVGTAASTEDDAECTRHRSRWRLWFALVLALALAVTIGSVFLTNGSVLR
jgi:hypothetical protein